MTIKTDFLELTGFKVTGMVQDPFKYIVSDCRNVPPESAEERILNSRGYRCDEFAKNHDGKHILFSGCSVTYGNGLELNETWAKKLYDKISINNKTSGYFNLGTSSAGVAEIVINIFKYIKEFGKPDVIFLNVPDHGRFFSYDNKQKKYIYINRQSNAAKDSSFLDTNFLISYHYLLMLEAYCLSNNIIFKYITWVQDKELTLSYLESFYKIDSNVLASMIVEYIENNPKDVYSELARDSKHFGTAYHHAWAHLMYNEYLREMEKNVN